MVAQMRCCSGEPSENAIQKPKMASAMKSGSGAMSTSSRPRAPSERNRAMRAGERGPMRPANNVIRLARKGRAARAARPMVSRPSRRATDGSSTPTTAIVLPSPTADDRSSARFRCSVLGRGRAAAYACTGSVGNWRQATGRHLDDDTAWPAR